MCKQTSLENYFKRRKTDASESSSSSFFFLGTTADTWIGEKQSQERFVNSKDIGNEYPIFFSFITLYYSIIIFDNCYMIFVI